MSRKLLAAALTGCAGILLCVLLVPRTKPVYAYSVAEFLAADVRDQEVRVSGHLVLGSLCRERADCGYRFALAGSSVPEGGSNNAGPDRRLWVSYAGCALPDTFRDVANYDFSVSVQGERCQGCHALRATQVIAKCPGKYEMSTNPAARLPASSPPPLCTLVGSKQL